MSFMVKKIPLSEIEMQLPSRLLLISSVKLSNNRWYNDIFAF